MPGKPLGCILSGYSDSGWKIWYWGFLLLSVDQFEISGLLMALCELKSISIEFPVWISKYDLAACWEKNEKQKNPNQLVFLFASEKHLVSHKAN